MSNAAMTWAWKQPLPSSSKFVLVAMADQVTTDLAFMSVRWLAEATGQDRKTVMANIARLVDWRLIEDTGERRGKTGQIPVYRLRMGADLFDNAPFSKGPKNGTVGTVPKTGQVPKAVPVPKTDGNGTSFPAERYQKRDTDLKPIPKDPSLSPRAGARERNGDWTGSLDSSREGEPPPVSPTPGALATKAMIAAGLPRSLANPSHPKLLAALDEGITPDELADVVREMSDVSRGTGPPNLPYVIQTARGRRRDAANQTDSSSHERTPARRPGNPRSSAAERVVAAMERRRAKGAPRVDPA